MFETKTISSFRWIFPLFDDQQGLLLIWIRFFSTVGLIFQFQTLVRLSQYAKNLNTRQKTIKMELKTISKIFISTVRRDEIRHRQFRSTDMKINRQKKMNFENFPQRMWTI